MPSSKDGLSFVDAPLSKGYPSKVLQKHLKACGLFEGESGHGMRRGTVIHDSMMGKLSLAEIGQRLQHKKPGGPQTQQYLDTSRETGKPKRCRRASTLC